MKPFRHDQTPAGPGGRTVLSVAVALLIGSAATPSGSTMPAPDRTEHVILLHGLARRPAAMAPMEHRLRQSGYETLNLGYPSRHKPIRTIADEHLAPAVEELLGDGASRIHFVTHSMGGIVVRDYLSRHDLPELGRVVMLAPPNRGSEVVDRIGHWKAFAMVNGPAGGQLGTGAEGVPQALGPIDFPCGVIAGDRSINWINSSMIEGRDDGKVSVENTKAEGIADHAVVHRTHPMIMRGPDTIALTLRFLESGSFAP